MWAPIKINNSVLRHAPTHKSMACFGSVSVQTGKLVHSLYSKFDAGMFAAPLKKLLCHRSHRMCMVAMRDNAWYHHAVVLATLLAAPCPDPTGVGFRQAHDRP